MLAQKSEKPEVRENTRNTFQPKEISKTIVKRGDEFLSNVDNTRAVYHHEISA